MTYIVATCIVLYNICIVNNEWIEENWIVETENKLATRVIEEKLREESELWEKKTKIIEVRRRILARHDALIPNKIIDVKINLLLLREIEKTNDILREATIMHNLLAKRLWRYKIWNKFGIPDSYNNSDSDIVE